MQHLKIFIVDDEQESINALTIKLERYCSNITIVGTSTEPESVINSFSDTDINLLFLDVEMPTLDGFSLLKQLKERHFEVIMVTAYSHYAIKAIKANVLDYLLKPVDIVELKTAVEKVRNKIKPINHNNSNQPKNANTRLILNSVNEIHYVDTGNILYILGENNYSSFYLINNQRVVVSKTLKDFEKDLEHLAFFRIHKSTIININYVQKVQKGLEFNVIMKNGQELEVSHRKRADFLKRMEQIN